MTTHDTTATRSYSTGSDAPSWLEPLGRAGYAAKGVVYCLVGVLAVMAAFGAGGSVGGSKNALVELGQAPFGQVILAAVGLGLLCYSAWRFVQTVVDPGDHGKDAEGVGKRVTYVVSGLTHLTLAFFAGSLVFGATSHAGSGSGGSSSSDWTAEIMSQPFGLWIVGIIGAIIAGFGLRQFHRAYEAEFMDRFNGEMDADKREAVKRIGQAGHVARGIVFCMIGAFVIQAAVQADPNETRGLGGALSALADQSYGPWLLAVVALGLAAYGVFCFAYARYRDFLHT